MIYRINLNWTASVNKIVEVEANSKEEALESILRRCEDHVEYKRNSPSDDSTPDVIGNDGLILPTNPDSAEYFLEDELCEVI